MSVFTPIFTSHESRPRSQFFNAVKANFIRDTLSLPTWIALGAGLQSVLFTIVPMRFAILPALLYIISRIAQIIFIWTGLRRNPYMTGVVPGKLSAQIPGSTTPAQNPIVVIRLAARSNHPLGTFHPHMRTISSFFKRMIKDLDDHSERYDYLGACAYIGNERETNNETMILAYFRTYEGLHSWSHIPGGVHREAWTYWNTEVMGKGKEKNGRMFSIMHEVYQISAKKWESIFVNYHPTGLGATTFKVDADGQEKWASPLVDASKGRLSTSKGRLAIGEGMEHGQHA